MFRITLQENRSDSNLEKDARTGTESAASPSPIGTAFSSQMQASDNFTKSLRKNATWLFSGNMAASVFAAIEPVLLAKFLGVEQFGLFGLIIAYVGIVNNGLVNFRSPESITRYVGQHLALGEKDKVLRFIKFFYLLDILQGILTFAACVLLAGVANDLFIRSDDAFALVLIYSVSPLFSSLNLNSEALLKVFDMYKISSFLRVLNTGARVTMVAACLFLGFGLKSVLICYVAATFIYLAALQVVVFGILRDRGFRRWTSARLGKLEFVTAEVRSFILTSIYSGFLNAVFFREFTVLVIGYFTSKEAVGLYKVATAFSGLREKLQYPMGEAMYPSLVAARSRDLMKALYEIVCCGIKDLMKIVLPAGVAVFLFANEIVGVLFGTEYEPAVRAMRIIVVSEILLGLCFWIDMVDQTLDRMMRRAVRVSLCSAVYVAALLFLVPAYSYEGAAISMLASSVLILGFSLFVFIKIRHEN